MRSRLFGALGIFLMASGAVAQLRPLAPRDVSSAVASTGVYQTVLSQDNNRSGCTIVNKGTNAMTIRQGGATLWPLPAGQAFYCHWQGVVVTSQIEITGTSGDAYAAAVE